MPVAPRLVTEYLENISGEILETDRNVIRDLIRRRSGVYALFRKDKLYYVGLATNLMGRLGQHLKDRHRGSWDRFSVYLTIHDDHLKELESLLLRITVPKGNKQNGKFRKATHLYQTLNRKLKEADAERRAALLGGGVANRRREAKVSRADRKLPLAGVFDRVVVLKGTRAGWEYTARLRRDGRIRYNGRLFDTPSHAGGTALRGACNGWTFWHYRTKRGEWVPLRDLRN